jgi:hypothetical protein
MQPSAPLITMFRCNLLPSPYRRVDATFGPLITTFRCNILAHSLPTFRHNLRCHSLPSFRYNLTTPFLTGVSRQLTRPNHYRRSGTTFRSHSVLTFLYNLTVPFFTGVSVQRCSPIHYRRFGTTFRSHLLPTFRHNITAHFFPGVLGQLIGPIPDRRFSTKFRPIPYRRFGTTFRSYSLLTFLYNLTVPFLSGVPGQPNGPVFKGCPETWVRNYHCALWNVPENYDLEGIQFVLQICNMFITFCKCVSVTWYGKTQRTSELSARHYATYLHAWPFFHVAAIVVTQLRRACGQSGGLATNKTGNEKCGVLAYYAASSGGFLPRSHCSLSNDPEERSSHLLRGETMKSRTGQATKVIFRHLFAINIVNKSNN